MIDPATIPIEDQIGELQRELSIRATVYKRFIAAGTLKQETADLQMARMMAALHTLSNVQAFYKAAARYDKP